MENKELDTITQTLFERDYFNEDLYTDEEIDALDGLAADCYEKYEWNDIWKSWYNYLITNCKSPKEVCNFANLFWIYDGQTHPIDNVYEFLGYIYYYLELNSAKYDNEFNALTIMDGITIEALDKANIKKDLWWNDPNYVPETDPVIIESVEKWKTILESPK